MNTTTVGAFVAVPLIVAPLVGGGVAGSGSIAAPRDADYALTSEALVMIPAMNQQWLDLSKELYLVPSGFDPDGTATFVQVPETNDLNASISGAREILLQQIESRWDDHDFGPADPLYVFGYSQAAVAAGMVEQQLSDYGIPPDALHFVMVGDSASADGGFLNEFMATLLQFVPASWRDEVIALVEEIAKDYHVDSVIGATTPGDLYPTDVYTLTGDGFANWDDGANAGGMFWDHLAYLGLTPEEIGSAVQTQIGDTTYFTIDSDDVDMTSALMNSFEMVTSPFV